MAGRVFSFRAGKTVAAAVAAGFAGTYVSLAPAPVAHAEAKGNEKYLMAGADGPEWASHVLGKRPWSVHSACIAANCPIEDRCAPLSACASLPPDLRRHSCPSRSSCISPGLLADTGSWWSRVQRASSLASSMGTMVPVRQNMLARTRV